MAIQYRQMHNGFLCTDKDQAEMRYHDRYRTLALNQRAIHVSIRDEVEERLMEREQIQLEARIEQETGAAPAKTKQGLSLYETRQLNEQNMLEMKTRMQEHITKKTQEFRNLKKEVKDEVMKEVIYELEEKKAEVIRQRDIIKIIKNEQKSELDRNI